MIEFELNNAIFVSKYAVGNYYLGYDLTEFQREANRIFGDLMAMFNKDK